MSERKQVLARSIKKASNIACNKQKKNVKVDISGSPQQMPNPNCVS